MASLVPAVIDALLGYFRASFDDEIVFDGAEPRPDDAALALVVGWNDTDDTTDVTQSIATLGTARSRNQVILIPCLLRHWTGDNGTTDVAAARTAVYATFATIETQLRTTPDLGLSQSTSYMRAQIVTERHRNRQHNNGLHADVLFTIQADCRI